MGANSVGEPDAKQKQASANLIAALEEKHAAVIDTKKDRSSLIPSPQPKRKSKSKQGRETEPDDLEDDDDEVSAARERRQQREDRENEPRDGREMGKDPRNHVMRDHAEIQSDLQGVLLVLLTFVCPLTVHASTCARAPELC